MENHLRTPLEEFEDKYHPVHFYCRLCEMDIREEIAYEIANLFKEYFYDKIVKYVQLKRNLERRLKKDG